MNKLHLNEDFESEIEISNNRNLRTDKYGYVYGDSVRTCVNPVYASAIKDRDKAWERFSSVNKELYKRCDDIILNSPDSPKSKVENIYTRIDKSPLGESRRNRKRLKESDIEDNHTIGKNHSKNFNKHINRHNDFSDYYDEFTGNYLFDFSEWEDNKNDILKAVFNSNGDYVLLRQDGFWIMANQNNF